MAATPMILQHRPQSPQTRGEAGPAVEDTDVMPPRYRPATAASGDLPDSRLRCILNYSSQESAMIVLATGALSLARLMQADRDRPRPDTPPPPPPGTAGRA